MEVILAYLRTETCGSPRGGTHSNPTVEGSMRRKVWKVEPTGRTDDVAKCALPFDYYWLSKKVNGLRLIYILIQPMLLP